MKICLVTHKVKRGDGQGRVNYEIVRAARAKGYQVTVLASECASEVIEEFGAEYVHIPVDRWPTQIIRNQIFALRSARWLRQKAPSFDIIHANGFITWYPAAINAAHFVHGAWLRSPYNNDSFSSGLKSAYHKLFSIINAYLEIKAFSSATRIVAVSPLVVDELLSIGVPLDKIIMISNGVDIDEFHPGAGLRAELAIDLDTPLAIFSGDLRSPRKNLETVLRAICEIPHWQLIVLSRVEGSSYPAMANDMGISDRVHFLGFRSDSAALMRTADVLVFPSRYDPCTLVVAEALASGVPVITAQSVGAAFQVQTNCGWVIDNPEDCDEIARLLKIILNMSAIERHEITKNARLRALEFTWIKSAESYLELFESIYCKSEKDLPLEVKKTGSVEQ